MCIGTADFIQSIMNEIFYYHQQLINKRMHSTNQDNVL